MDKLHGPIWQWVHGNILCHLARFRVSPQVLRMFLCRRHWEPSGKWHILAVLNGALLYSGVLSEHVTKSPLPALKDIYMQQRRITRHPSHLDHGLFSEFRLSNGYHSLRINKERLRGNVFPQGVWMLSEECAFITYATCSNCIVYALCSHEVYITMLIYPEI